jgi:hypothetical protein
VHWFHDLPEEGSNDMQDGSVTVEQRKRGPHVCASDGVKLGQTGEE